MSWCVPLARAYAQARVASCGRGTYTRTSTGNSDSLENSDGLAKQRFCSEERWDFGVEEDLSFVQVDWLDEVSLRVFFCNLCTDLCACYTRSPD